jgi:hypothetical protein
MSLGLPTLLPLLFAVITCAAVVSSFVGWRHPLAATWSHPFTGRAALGIVLLAEGVWLASNVCAVQILRQSWTVSRNFFSRASAIAVAMSFPAQVFLGHLAIRDLLVMIRETTK